VLPLPDVEPPGLEAAFDGRPGLVLTGEGCFDRRSLRGSVVAAVAR
jgi:glycerate kinase